MTGTNAKNARHSRTRVADDTSRDAETRLSTRNWRTTREQTALTRLPQTAERQVRDVPTLAARRHLQKPTAPARAPPLDPHYLLSNALAASTTASGGTLSCIHTHTHALSLARSFYPSFSTCISLTRVSRSLSAVRGFSVTRALSTVPRSLSSSCAASRRVFRLSRLHVSFI